MKSRERSLPIDREEPAVPVRKNAKEKNPLVFLEDLKAQEGVEVYEHEYGSARIREYINRTTNAYAESRADRALQADSFVPEIELITGGGQFFRLSLELPKGYRFVRLEGEGSPFEDWVNRYIVYSKVDRIAVVDGEGRVSYTPMNMWEYSGSALGLAHEIGHAFKSLALSRKELRRRAKLRDRQGQLSAKDREEFLRTVFQDERDAWAHALSRVRELRHLGIDLEPGMDLKKIEEIVHVNLYSYEVLLSGPKPLPNLDSFMRSSLHPKREQKKEKTS